LHKQHDLDKVKRKIILLFNIQKDLLI